MDGVPSLLLSGIVLLLPFSCLTKYSTLLEYITLGYIFLIIRSKDEIKNIQTKQIKNFVNNFMHKPNKNVNYKLLLTQNTCGLLQMPF